MGEFFWFEEAHREKDNPLQGEGATAIEQHIPRRSGPVGQECLVEFITAGDKSGREQRQQCIENET